MTFDKDISYVKSCNVGACKSLWAAVLEQAIEDILDNKGYYMRKVAMTWLRCKNDGVGSFLWICHLFDLNPESSRKRIESISQKLHGSTLNLSAPRLKTPTQPLA
jgi:hypothetical protein